ncbi:MAG TPA: RICIN domain-containing protein, partial [Chthoniobacteraceae bacterium]|nr:RICIN domain-containing protein [Chthoniobacteraceae bacterium]
DKKQGGQVWRFIPDGKGNYFIQSQASELYLNAKYDGEIEDQVNQSPDMVWALEPDGKGGVNIRSVVGGTYLNTWFGNKDVGGRIDQGGKDDKQGWKLIPADSDL